MKYSAQFVVALSALLLLFVGIDFFKVQELNEVQKRESQKSDLVAKVDGIGKVLAGCGFCPSLFVKDKDTNELLTGAYVKLTAVSNFTACGVPPDYTESYDSSTWNMGYNSSNGAYVVVCSIAPGQSAPSSYNVTVSKSGYSTKNQTLSLVGEIGVVLLEKAVSTQNSSSPPSATTTKKTTVTTTTVPETIKDVALPVAFGSSNSTNLATIPDPTKVENLTLDTDKGTIKFTTAVDLSTTDTKDKFKELDKYVKVEKTGVVSIDSTNLPALNKPATITMKGLTFVKTPKVLVDGKEDKTVISNITYKNGTLTFDVTHFSTFTAAPTLGINEPADNFETSDKIITLKGTVSDLTASVSAKLNNKDLGKLKVATNGAYEKEIELEEGTNKIVVNALGVNLATASASVSGTLTKSMSLMLVYILLLILLAIGIGGGIYGFKRMKTKKEVAKVSANTSVEPTKPV